MHSTQPAPLGSTVGLIPFLSDFIGDHRRCFQVSRRLAVSDARVALPNFYDVAVGIANIAARLTVLGLGLREELGSSTSPQFIARLNICNADIHEAAD